MCDGMQYSNNGWMWVENALRVLVIALVSTNGHAVLYICKFDSM